jgi:hypothetical protein
MRFIWRYCWRLNSSGFWKCIVGCSKAFQRIVPSSFAESSIPRTAEVYQLQSRNDMRHIPEELEFRYIH